jgi:hypothetical protein
LLAPDFSPQPGRKSAPFAAIRFDCGAPGKELIFLSRHHENEAQPSPPPLFFVSRRSSDRRWKGCRNGRVPVVFMSDDGTVIGVDDGREVFQYHP